MQRRAEVANSSDGERRLAVRSPPAVRKKKGEYPSPIDPAVDQELREHLREWRRTTAKENSIAAFIILHDTTLDELCRRRPQSIAELLRVPGIGERKAELYGKQILSALKEHRGGARSAQTPQKKLKSA